MPQLQVSPQDTTTHRDFFLPAFAGLSLLFFIFRFLTLWTAIETVSWHEELAVGAVARELMLGLKSSLWTYQLDYYSGDSIILSFITSLFFKGFGINLFVLKLVPLFFSYSILCVTAHFLRRHFGASAALWSSFFLIFSPPALVSQSMILMGAHYEALLFAVLTLAFFYESLWARPESKFFLVLFGFTAGLSF